jgi:regulator of sigma D
MNNGNGNNLIRSDSAISLNDLSDEDKKIVCRMYGFMSEFSEHSDIFPEAIKKVHEEGHLSDDAFNKINEILQENLTTEQFMNILKFIIENDREMGREITLENTVEDIRQVLNIPNLQIHQDAPTTRITDSGCCSMISLNSNQMQ